MTFIQNLSPQWLEEQYRRWQQDPESLEPEWRSFFAGFDLGRETPLELSHPDLPDALRNSGVQSLIYRYRDIGHLIACTDPLSPCTIAHPHLDLAAFDLAEPDLDTVFHTRRYHKDSATLREILETMQETYCRSIGVEFMYIQEPAERQWLIDRMEPLHNRPHLDPEEQLHLLAKLQEATLFEEFLHRRFLGQKRFSLEGGESLIVCLDQAIAHGAAKGVRDVVIGTAHRGRLNVLANILGKPLANIFAEFEDNLLHGVVGEGDVKYHKGYSADRELPEGERLHLSLAFNPSHLEAVDPVVEGKSRAHQDRAGERGKQEVLPILVHGDAAFAGQGIVAETLNLSQLEGYGTGGTLHIVLNNQIGFTTLPADARSTRYATDVARMLMVPIFHVHGEDPEAVAWVAKLALDYRQAYGRDVVVEIICYRRHGHNEGDEPAFTQPLMYEQIRQRPAPHLLYAARLEEQGVTAEIVREMVTDYSARLEAAVGQDVVLSDQGFNGDWRGVSRDYHPANTATAVPHELLTRLATELTSFPATFTPHPKLVALYQKRLSAVQQGEGIDWGNAEALAFASLLQEGVSVRLSGQDSRRGTFNHRHAVLHDLHSEKSHTPLAALPGGAAFRIYDSMLSESAVLGFEYGYSVATPEWLTIWEAQFGDFANGAQVIIDQFIASGENKWDRASGLVLLLPHGYDGNGAEHSSARIERFLSLCAENNLQVAYPSTPGQMFHLLRRQMKQAFRKPLIVFTPKSLLRNPACTSSLAELTSGGFQEVLVDTIVPEDVTTVLLCSGKIYYELLERRESTGRNDLAIIRIEQLYPFRDDLLREALAPYLPDRGSDSAAYQGGEEGATEAYHEVRRGAPDETNASRQSKSNPIKWVQEEPANMGAWQFLRPFLTEQLGREPVYVGRPAAAAPAIGSHRLHGVEQAQLIDAAFGTI
jgi:2-oxoglutarate dehydrogenase E1 component